MRAQISIEFLLLFSFELFGILASLILLDKFLLSNHNILAEAYLEYINQEIVLEILNGYKDFNITLNTFCNFNVTNGTTSNFSFHLDLNGYFKCGKNEIKYVNGIWVVK